jgi:drug/metabolite transporter (DMT)-like permease
MSLAAVLLVITSAFLHASWNAILKRVREPEIGVLAMITIGSTTAVVVALVLRVPFPPRASLLWSLAAGVLESGYLLTLARALARAPLGPVYTIARGGALLVVWPISIILLGEEVTASRIAGTVLVLVGLAATGNQTRNATDEQKRDRSGFLWAALCAVFVGSYHLAYKLALAKGGNAPAADAISLSAATVVNFAFAGFAKGRLALGALRRDPVRIIMGGILANLSFLLFLFAMAQGGAGVLLTLRNTSILFAQVFAFFLGERPRRLGIVGAVLVTIGAVLLAR